MKYTLHMLEMAGSDNAVPQQRMHLSIAPNGSVMEY